MSLELSSGDPQGTTNVSISGLGKKQRNTYDDGPFDLENPPLGKSRCNESERLVCLPSRSIYTVPKRLRHVKPKAYTPSIVSIGPIHHGQEHLQAMEKQKVKYLEDLIDITKLGKESYKEVVRKNEVKLRACYDEPIEFDSDKFVEIILVDAAFIIGVLFKSKFCTVQAEGKNRELEEDRIFGKPWLLQDIWVDMLLIENQLPFFILNDLFKHQGTYTTKHGEPVCIFDLVHNFFIVKMGLEVAEGRIEEIDRSNIVHFVDFLRQLHLPSSMHARKELETTIPSITELHGAGVKFKVGLSKNLFDLDFKKRQLKVPKIIIGDETEILIRNFIAFEQCHCKDDAYINDYVILMNCLINTEEDLRLLAEHGIVENRCSNKERGSSLINKLQDGAIFNKKKFYFYGLCAELDSYYRKPLHKWKANLKQKYFSTPWAATSVSVAAALLLLTLIQTVCSIISAVYARCA